MRALKSNLLFLQPVLFCAVATMLAMLTPAIARGESYAATDLFTLQTPTGFSSGYPATFGLYGYHPIAEGQVVGYGRNIVMNDISDALFWPGPDGSAVDLNPAGSGSSEALAIGGGQEVGDGGPGNESHALLWTGTAVSAVDLNPSGFADSFAKGVGGGMQVGYGSGATTSGNSHALLWSGTASSAIDLNPTVLIGFVSSEALGVEGDQQVGDGYGAGTGNYHHALLWNGTAASAVDLNPVGYSDSYAYAVDDSQQVGAGYSNSANGNEHALFWSGTPTSVIDLNPTGFTTSDALDIGDGKEVGYGYGSATGGIDNHALLWSGTPASYIDLGVLLVPTEYTASWAYSIDPAGNIFGLATDTNGNYHAIEWSSVPEPASAMLVGLSLFGLLARHREK